LADAWRDANLEVVQTPRVVSVQDSVPNDPYWPQQYGPGRIQLPSAWNVTTGASHIIIAVIDTGIDLDHPDLQGKLVPGRNWIDELQPPDDDHGHGTHVAGIAAASTHNGVGVAGASWGALLMPLKVLDATGNGDDADVAAAIVWAADHGADVINLSLGGPCPSPVMEFAATYAYTMGVTVVAATGNQNGSVLCPAAASTVIAVAATDSSNVRAGFSNIGPEVDVAAPGVGVYSTGRGGGYEYRSGTSMATPFVAGVAALLACQPQFTTPAQIRAALENTTLDLGQPGPDVEYGAGLIQADAALRYNSGGTPAPHCYTFYLPTIQQR
jgi:subtilisin family serine protease